MKKIVSDFSFFGDKVVLQVKELAARNGESNSVAAISRRCRIPQSTLNSKMNNPGRLTLRDLYFIATALEVDLRDFFN